MTHDSADLEKLRYMVIIDKRAHARLTEVTAKHKLSQSDVLEILLLETDFNAWAERFAAARENKVRARALKRTAMQKLRTMNQEELERLVELAKQNPEA